MNKWVLVIITVILVGIFGFVAFNNNFSDQKQVNSMENTTPIPTDMSYKVTPISHATMVLQLDNKTIYTDPVGEAALFNGQPTPDIILVTDIHGDHMDANTLQTVAKDTTTLIVPQAVADELPEGIPGTLVVMKNGEVRDQNGVKITAVPMYNVPETEDSRHTKGRGNGYILEAAGKRIYVAGDTGGTPEMRGLQDIDVAFVPMNLPYTMSVEDAADAVLAFKPKVVHPYHYRGPDGLADINKFKELVNAGDPNITVELLNFYSEQ